MGLGLTLLSRPLKHGLLRRAPSAQRVAERLLKLAHGTDPLFRSLGRVVVDDDGSAMVFLYPTEEPVFVKVERAQLGCNARTSGAGPGYHAFVVELLDRLAEDLGTSWLPEAPDAANSAEDAGTFDETGYFTHRDVARLQDEMLAWLRGLSGALTADRGEPIEGPFLVCMPVETELPSDLEFVTPLGARDRLWFLETSRAEGEALSDRGEEWFAWWGQGVDAIAVRNAGVALLWSDVAWHPPLDDAEAEAMRRVLACFDRAQAIDRAVTLPDLELAELRTLVRADPADARPPAPNRLGLKRHELRRQLTGGWSLRLPGYWYLQDEDGSLQFWLGEREVHATTFTIEGASRSHLIERERAQQKTPSVLSFSTDRMDVEGCLLETGEDGLEHLQVVAAIDAGLCVLTLVYPAGDSAWAESVARSLAPPPARRANA